MNDRHMRSPELMSRRDCGLLVIDVQERLVPAIAGQQRIVWNIRRLIDAARIVGLPGHGDRTVPQGARSHSPGPGRFAPGAVEQVDVQLRGLRGTSGRVRDAGRDKVLVAGIEAHVCVQQTVLDLLSDGFRVYVAVDAVGSRFEFDYHTALKRMDSAGATLTTTEAAMFEWCEIAGTPEFKQISALAREQGPA